MPEHKNCAVCGYPASQRLALMLGGRLVATIPLCPNHASSVQHGHWAMQVEHEWGGAWLDGGQYRD